MKINIKKLPKTVEELEEIIFLQQREIEKNKQEITSHKERYIRLLEEFKLEKSRHYASSSEKNILQSDLFDEAGIKLDGELKDQLDDTIDIEGYQRKRHPVRRSIPKDMPREIIIHDILEHEKVCDCGVQLVRIGEEISEQIKYIPAQLSVVQHVRPKYACKPCQENDLTPFQ
jgi:transposase